MTACPCVRQFYGYLSQQQNMMQDYVRTGTYQRAILQNHSDFKDKVCGTAIVSGGDSAQFGGIGRVLGVFRGTWLVWGDLAHFGEM